ncbi:hypothetical protein FOA52_008188 [Chlamydomonas sp. UWO 241]|nr:hypothetical protein FOA52_008188 [Chlamydomonas sp. UWO 241]
MESLKACTRLRKLDLRGCSFPIDEDDEWEDEFAGVDSLVADLQLTCTQLQASGTSSSSPPSVALQGLVHELQPSLPPNVQCSAANSLGNLAAHHYVHSQAFIAAAGAIPALAQLLGPESSTGARQAAVRALGNLADGHVQNKAAITAADAIPHVVLLLGPGQSAHVHKAAADLLNHLALDHAQNKAAITAAGAIPAFVQLLGSEPAADLQKAAAGALGNLAFNHAQNTTAITDAGAIPALWQMMGPKSSADVQQVATTALRDLGFFYSGPRHWPTI